jgi:rhodanese-related sulfurtransferase
MVFLSNINKHIVILVIIVGFPLLVHAQMLEISSDQVRAHLAGKKKAVLIDVRTPDEYRNGHIPGAINIPADRMLDQQTRLPRDRTTPLIFYCRGVG